jgi:hypothetical protein
MIERRFCGPDESANGGYACGVVASLIIPWGPAEVTLRSPPPLEVGLDVERDDGRVRLFAAGTLVAEGKPATVDVEAPAPPTSAEAAEASTRYAWHEDHPYPRCFVCGPKRDDGLSIFPGATGQIAAAPFVPDATVCDESGLLRPEIVWAALDCPSWFGFHALHADFRELVLLGRLAARIDARPRAGERCICAGWFIGREGRKIHCGSALYGESGAVQAVARATWIVLQR